MCVYVYIYLYIGSLYIYISNIYYRYTNMHAASGHNSPIYIDTRSSPPTKFAYIPCIYIYMVSIYPCMHVLCT